MRAGEHTRAIGEPEGLTAAPTLSSKVQKD